MFSYFNVIWDTVMFYYSHSHLKTQKTKKNIQTLLCLMFTNWVVREWMARDPGPSSPNLKTLNKRNLLRAWAGSWREWTLASTTSSQRKTWNKAELFFRLKKRLINVDKLYVNSQLYCDQKANPRYRWTVQTLINHLLTTPLHCMTLYTHHNAHLGRIRFWPHLSSVKQFFICVYCFSPFMSSYPLSMSTSCSECLQCCAQCQQTHSEIHPTQYTQCSQVHTQEADGDKCAVYTETSYIYKNTLHLQ